MWNARLFILPRIRPTSLASKVLSLCLNRVCEDWVETYGVEPVLLEAYRGIRQAQVVSVSDREADFHERFEKPAAVRACVRAAGSSSGQPIGTRCSTMDLTLGALRRAERFPSDTSGDLTTP